MVNFLWASSAHWNLLLCGSYSLYKYLCFLILLLGDSYAISSLIWQCPFVDGILEDRFSINSHAGFASTPKLAFLSSVRAPKNITFHGCPLYASLRSALIYKLIFPYFQIQKWNNWYISSASQDLWIHLTIYTCLESFCWGPDSLFPVFRQVQTAPPKLRMFFPPREKVWPGYRHAVCLLLYFQYWFPSPLPFSCQVPFFHQCFHLQ